jgi:thiol-disulfide isomerase/thioredoxin
MKKLTVIITIIIVAALGIVLFISAQSQTTPPVTSPQPGQNDLLPQTTTQPDNSQTTTTQQNTGSYVEYSKTELDQTADKRRVLYFFASWCPTCIPADANFRQNSDKIPSDVAIIRINYNDPETDQEEKDLAAKYGITYQHTFVQIDAQGNQVHKWNGGQIDELLANIK